MDVIGYMQNRLGWEQGGHRKIKSETRKPKGT